MRTSEFLLATLKESPSDAVVISHQLMLRSGMIRKLASGLYTWLPLGLRTLRKVEKVVREEMDKSGAQELLMPMVQPAELWQETGRWQKYGAELLRFHDRHQRDFCLGPTHEEVISDLIRNEISSYKQLPANFYQIQGKFRDEIRPRFGMMRAREFLMKDAYSFHVDETCLQQTYERMHQTYQNIFSRLGLDFRPVQADGGSIGGNFSHEFHVLAESGEDLIAFSDQSDYAANIEMARCSAPDSKRPNASQARQKVATPDAKTIAEVCKSLAVLPQQTVKTLLVNGAEDGEEKPAASSLVALVLRGDHSLNEIKAEKLPGVANPLRLASDEQVQQALGCSVGSIGPQGLAERGIPLWVDHSASALADFVCGANEDGYHYTGFNWQRDAELDTSVDLRNIEVGDPSPDGQGNIVMKRGIEVGHIFQLGRKYSDALGLSVLDPNGKSVTPIMGCYGIGVSRVVAAAIEQNHDERGIIWPQALAPFDIALVPLNYHKKPEVKERTEALYEALQEAGFAVLLDDRDKKVSPGVKFADMELIGIPHRLVISDRGIDANQVEYKARDQAESQDLALDQVLSFMRELYAQ